MHPLIISGLPGAIAHLSAWITSGKWKKMLRP